MGATHFRAIAQADLFEGCVRERKAGAPKNFVDETLEAEDGESSCWTAGPSDREYGPFEKDPEDPEPITPDAESNAVLKQFLECRAARRRPAVAFECGAFENGTVATLLTTKEKPEEIQQHAAVLTPSALHFWGVDVKQLASNTRSCMGGCTSQPLVGKLEGKLEWIWEDTLHSCKVRGLTESVISKASNPMGEASTLVCGDVSRDTHHKFATGASIHAEKNFGQSPNSVFGFMQTMNAAAQGS